MYPLRFIIGFDLSTMGTDVYDEAIVDVVGPKTVLSKPVVVKVNARRSLFAFFG